MDVAVVGAIAAVVAAVIAGVATVLAARRAKSVEVPKLDVADFSVGTTFDPRVGRFQFVVRNDGGSPALISRIEASAVWASSIDEAPVLPRFDVTDSRRITGYSTGPLRDSMRVQGKIDLGHGMQTAFGVRISQQVASGSIDKFSLFLRVESRFSYEELLTRPRNTILEFSLRAGKSGAPLRAGRVLFGEIGRDLRVGEARRAVQEARREVSRDRQYYRALLADAPQGPGGRIIRDRGFNFRSPVHRQDALTCTNNPVNTILAYLVELEIWQMDILADLKPYFPLRVFGAEDQEIDHDTVGLLRKEIEDLKDELEVGI